MLTKILVQYKCYSADDNLLIVENIGLGLGFVTSGLGLDLVIVASSLSLVACGLVLDAWPLVLVWVSLLLEHL